VVLSIINGHVNVTGTSALSIDSQKSKSLEEKFTGSRLRANTSNKMKTVRKIVQGSSLDSPVKISKKIRKTESSDSLSIRLGLGLFFYSKIEGHLIITL